MRIGQTGGKKIETSEWTSRDSNHHRQSVSAGKTNAIPTEPSGRLWDVCCRRYSYRSPGIFVSKVESAQFGDPLCGNIWSFWLVSEESFWLCAYLDERAEVVQCASSALVGRAYSALENSMLAFFEEAIWNS